MTAPTPQGPAWDLVPPRTTERCRCVPVPYYYTVHEDGTVEDHYRHTPTGGAPMMTLDERDGLNPHAVRDHEEAAQEEAVHRWRERRNLRRANRARTIGMVTSWVVWYLSITLAVLVAAAYLDPDDPVVVLGTIVACLGFLVVIVAAMEYFTRRR